MRRWKIALLFLLTGSCGAWLGMAKNREVASHYSERPGAKEARMARDARIGGQAAAPAENIDQMMKDAGVYPTGPQVEWSLLKQDGSLDEAALEKAGIDSGQRIRIGEAVATARAAMGRSLAARVQPDERKPPGEEDEIWYRIPADPEGGSKILVELSSQFTAICGKEKGAELMAAFRPLEQFGSFGKLDISLRWMEEDFQGTKRWVAELHGYEHETGIAVGGGRFSDQVSFERHLGDSFEWPK